MKTLKLRALKPHRYGTRHLTAGEEYEAPIREAAALMATKKAQAIKAGKGAVAPSRAVQSEDALAPPEPQAERSLDDLRLQATQLGINVDGRWGVARLQHEIAQARR